MNLSVVIPIYNEDELLEHSVKKIFSHSKNFSKFELIAVDDGSSDKTPFILEKLSRRYKTLKIVRHKKNKGYGAALRSGIKSSRFNWVFFTDADLQFSLEDLSKFLPYTNKFDFIVGYRKNRADSSKRKFTSWVYNRTIKILFSLPLRDVDCAFKLMRRSSVSQISFFSDSFFVSTELMVKAYKKKFRIMELGVRHLPRKRGKSTVTLRRILHSIHDLIKLNFTSL